MSLELAAAIKTPAIGKLGGKDVGIHVDAGVTVFDEFVVKFNCAVVFTALEPGRNRV